MSKFRTRIRDVGRAPGGFGFTALARRERPRYVLVVAAAGSVDEANAAVEAGADAVVFAGGLADGASLRVPLGVRIEGASRADVERAREHGADFFIFDDAMTHASALNVDEIGSVLILGGDREEERLRAVSAIELDAVLVEAPAGPMTVREQLGLRRVAAFTGAPLLVQAQGQPDAAVLEAWRDAGAPAVLVAAGDVGRTLEAAAEVPAPRKSERRLPALGATTTGGHDHDHDDDDEDDD